MLSYRHAFHAGNHADVLKHVVQMQVLQHLNQKDKPYWYIDTHAGAGMYALEEGYATKKSEFRDGIGRLWSKKGLPPELVEYVELVRSFNADGVLRHYPGSPFVAERCLRADDRMRLFELHPADHDLLAGNIEDWGRRALLQKADGFAGLKAFLPPPPRRALVLIDPPYEVKDDYLRVVSTLEDALKRFATGVYAVWYPLLQRQDAQALPENLKHLPVESWLHVSLTVNRPSADGFGMHGSGMFILNPPWTLADSMKEIMRALAKALALDDGACYSIDYKSK